MSRKMTEIHLPDSKPSVGHADWGEWSAEEMIAKFRSYAAHLRAQAEEIESAPNGAFQINSYTGVHVQRNHREIQRSDRRP